MQQWSVSSLFQGQTPSRSNASVALYGHSVFMFGGSNQDGAATNTLFVLDLGAIARGGGWHLLECSGDVPSPRWGHSSFTYEQKLWVYGGMDGNHMCDDLFCLDLASSGHLTWEKVPQGGMLPVRDLCKHKSFHCAVAASAGHVMLAFGAVSQDAENTDPSRSSKTPALRLHAFDLDQRKWGLVHTAGNIPFHKLEALQCHADKLIAVGWSPGTCKGDNTMQVCCLDISSITSCKTPSFKFGAARSRPTPSWQQVLTQGMLPSTRTSTATAVMGNQLLMHGGMLCSTAVAGRLAADIFCLNLSTWVWTRLTPAQERAVGSNSINTPRASHSAVAIPSAAVIMLIGGTSSRHTSASCDMVQCLRQIGLQPANSTSSSQGTTATLSANAVLPGIEEVLSGTPTLLGIQPFGHVITTPKFIMQHPAGTPNTASGTPAGSGTVAVTPAVNLNSTPGASARAAAAAAAPSSVLRPTYNFSKFCFNDALSDIELVAGGRCFPAHRLLLCAQSPRLAELIHSQMAAANTNPHPNLECKWILNLPDVYPDILALMLEYMYCSLKTIPADAAPLLFKAADRYGLAGLRAASLRVVIATIDLDTVCHNVLLAHDHKCSELSQACILFVSASPERFQQVLATPGYLSLNQNHPRVGTAFVQAVTQLLMARPG